MFPRVHILGAPKSATSSLHVALTDSTGMCGCSGLGCVSGKELSVWWGFYDGVNGKVPGKVRNLSAAQYAKSFEPPNDSRCAVGVDSTPSRLYEWFAPPELGRLAAEAGLLAEMRLVAILREPVSRHLSWYNHRLVDRVVPAANHRYVRFWQKPNNPERYSLCEE